MPSSRAAPRQNKRIRDAAVATITTCHAEESPRVLRHPIFASILWALCLGAPAVHADEGMWTFDNFPSSRVQARYGFAPDAAWLDHVRSSAVRLTSGCSASVVSKDGLVLTNHHCVIACEQTMSTAEQDYVAHGFLTHARTEERQCPGMQAEILRQITDVTAPVQGAIAAADPKDAIKSRDAATARIAATPSRAPWRNTSEAGRSMRITGMRTEELSASPAFSASSRISSNSSSRFATFSALSTVFSTCSVRNRLTSMSARATASTASGSSAKSFSSSVACSRSVRAALGTAFAPAAMVFVPSRGGISHSPEEFTDPESCVAGANVLLAALLRLDVAL